MRTYAIRLRSCHELRKRVKELREMDVESRKFEDSMPYVRQHALVRQKVKQFHEWNQGLVSVAGTIRAETTLRSHCARHTTL